MNPFYTSSYHEPDNFCNRTYETKQIVSNALNGRNSTLFALRRLGKTALVKHALDNLKTEQGVTCLYLDIFACEALVDFSNELANAIYTHFPQNKSIGKRFSNAIKLLRPVISFDALSGEPQITLDIQKPTHVAQAIPEILKFLDAQNEPILIAIDEFQQILKFPEKNVEAILRSCIQHLKNVRFIFCGSNQSMMNEIFENAKRPFYASCTHLYLGHIEQTEYATFIARLMAKCGRKIDIESIEFILEFTQVHTYYTQFVCHTIVASGKKNIDLTYTMQVCKNILDEHEGMFFQLRSLLTAPQWLLLHAIAMEELLFQPYSKDFIAKYKLGTPAIVKRSLDALITKDLIYHFTQIDKPYYAVYDKFLMRWLQRK